MAKLDRVGLELLDFLCAAKHHRCRVIKLRKPALRDALQSLRYAGLVSLEGLEPSPSALADWRERKQIDQILEEIQTPAPKRIPEPADSPEPEAREEGGAADARAAARNAAEAPPTPRKGTPRIAPDGAMPGAALAAEIDRFLETDAAKGLSQSRLSWWLFKSPSGLAKLRGRKWVGDKTVARVRAFIAAPDPAAWSASYFKSRKAEPDANPPAKIIPDIIPESRAPLGDRRFREFRHERDPQPDPIPEKAAEICEELCEPAEPEAPAFEISQTEQPEPIGDRQRFDIEHRRQSAGKTSRLRSQARKRIDQGLSAGSAPAGALRQTQIAMEAQDAEEARLACPVETAKTALRKRYSPVIGAEIRDGEAGKGFFYVGSRRVSEAELLEMAGRIAA